ncbi:MAG: tetratricopeptide repeat protein [Actinobacteria bacterium]|nr:tetratricopeptide repeat protein [Actinomycetota bacterium]
MGPLEARAEGRAIPLGAPRQRLLLAALLLAAPRPLQRERLIDEVWGATPPASAGHAVEVYVSRLRAALGPTAIVGGPGASYATAQAADAHRFERLVSGEPGEGELAEGLALWRGEILSDVRIEGSLGAEVARLEELRVGARELLADRRLRRGGHEEALPDLRELVASEPLRERARALLMLALYRAGRQTEALDCFRAGRELLVGELGIEPAAELRELQEGILRQDPALADPSSRRRRNLPAPPTPLVGREREVEELASLLRDPARLLTLTGPGGIGKTRLALAAAEALLDDFPDGAHFVDLAPLRDPAAVVPAIAHAVGVDAEAALVPQLSEHRSLLLLDNFEQVLDAAPAVGALLAGAPGVRVLATSRVRLDLYGEHEFAVDPLDQDGGVELFGARARARDRRFVATAAVADVVARVERLPLAIELVASRVDRMSAEEMAAGLPVLDLASGGPRDVPDRHRALRAAIDWSLDLLDEDERQRFAALGAFAGGLDAEAAEAVLGATPADLDRLAGQSLLRRLPERWAMLEVLRERAVELLDPAAPVWELHATHYLKLAERAEPGLKGPEQAVWGERIEREHDNLRAALDRAEPLVALRIAAALGFFWYTHGYSAEGALQLERTLAAAPQAPALLRGRALQPLGILRSQRGDERAEATFGEALAMFRAAGDETRIGVALNSLAAMARERGDTAAARAAFEEAIELYRALDDRQRLADPLSNLGVVAVDQGELEEAAALFEESAALDRAFDNQWGLAQTFNGQAALALARGEAEAATALLAEAVEVQRRLDDRPSLMRSLEQLAATAAVRGDDALAARLWGAATAQREQAGEPRSEAEAAAIDRHLDASRSALGEDRFATAAGAGGALELGAALEQALAGADPPSGRDQQGTTSGRRTR